jgi:hypothetical protein
VVIDVRHSVKVAHSPLGRIMSLAVVPVHTRLRRAAVA